MISHQIVCVGPSLAAPLEPLAHRRNVARLSLFCRYYFYRCSSELSPVPPAPSHGRSARYSNRLSPLSSLIGCRYSVTIPGCYKDVYINSSFPRTPRFWNSLPAECFPLTYDLNGFKSRVNRHIFSLCSF